MNAAKLVRPASLLVAALVGMVLGACGPHSEYRIEKTCKKYCARAVDCNDNISFDTCVNDCVDTANDCNSDSDIEQALDILETCADEACNDVAACVADSWIECAF